MEANKPFEFKVSTAYGVEIDTIEASSVYDRYETLDEAKAANQMPKAKEILALINAKAKSAARAKETVIVLEKANYKPPNPTENEQERLKQMAKLFEMNKNTPTVARQKAEAALGVKFAA